MSEEKRPVRETIARRLKAIRRHVELLPAAERVLVAFILGGASLADLSDRYLALTQALRKEAR